MQPQPSEHPCTVQVQLAGRHKLLCCHVICVPAALITICGFPGQVSSARVPTCLPGNPLEATELTEHAALYTVQEDQANHSDSLLCQELVAGLRFPCLLCKLSSESVLTTHTSGVECVDSTHWESVWMCECVVIWDLGSTPLSYLLLLCIQTPCHTDAPPGSFISHLKGFVQQQRLWPPAQFR